MVIIGIAAATIIGVIVAALIDRKRGTRKTRGTLYVNGKFGRRTVVLLAGASLTAFFVFVSMVSVILPSYDAGAEREDVDGTLWYCRYVEETHNADWFWPGMTYTNTQSKVIDDCTVISGPTDDTEK